MVRVRFPDEYAAILKKCVIKQNWNRLTLFNLSRLPRQNNNGRTFFQQKWTAKQESRRYHGEQLSKRQWQNIFKSSLASVVPMKTTNLGASDGSQFAEGRGSGLAGVGEGGGRKFTVPYMNQVYAPMERRLDTALFRAMFASSSLQARQFCIHGFVKVNGKKMVHPQYMLNPGDMFSVQLDKMLFAVGAPKAKPNYVKKKKNAAATEETEETEGEEATEAAEGEAKEGETAVEAKEDTARYPKHWTAEDIATFKTTTLEQHRAQTDPTAARWKNDANREAKYDASKPYRTPWVPRDYLSAFAFIPRYLEVNHNTGHAVYLRHPVAQPGQSEVATPFHIDTMQLAHNWFLRRK